MANLITCGFARVAAKAILKKHSNASGHIQLTGPDKLSQSYNDHFTVHGKCPRLSVGTCLGRSTWPLCHTPPLRSRCLAASHLSVLFLPHCAVPGGHHAHYLQAR